jgi:hypothetical protein
MSRLIKSSATWSKQRNALERFGREKFGVKELDDWYSVPAMSVLRGLNFMKSHRSLFNALKKFYPDHNWDPLRFSRIPKGSYTQSMQRAALERLGKQLGVKELDDWYSVSSERVKRSLTFINNVYHSSLYNALKTLYPQHEWDPLKFSKVPHGYWNEPKTVNYYHELFSDWKREYNIRTVRDWHQLAPQKVTLFKRASVAIFGSKRKMLEEWFPDILWRSQYVSQLELKVC